MGRRWLNGPSGLKLNYYYLYLFLLGVAVLCAGVFLAQKQIHPASSRGIECGGQSEQDFSCWRERYKHIIDTQSPKEALADAQAKYDSISFVKDNCHEIAHIIGRAAGKKYLDISEAFRLGNDFCASGYYHGVMQAVADLEGKERIKQKVNKVCEPLAQQKRYGMSHYNCVHGLGHGLMSIEGNELFEALKGCEGLEGQWQQDSCYSGVFMENIIGEIDPGHHTEYLKADDPLYPCTAVEEKYRRMCYFLQTDHALIVEKADFAKVFEHCSKLEKEYGELCYQSLGRNASSYSLYDIDKTRQRCMLGATDNAKVNCIRGAALDFVWRDQDRKNALSFCFSLENKGMAEHCRIIVNDFKYKD